ncbi:MAG: hypothetical protein Q7S51_04670 [Gallionellaceae bacterium]|nr:hypothetical protein [Gallionellaceae bacterium]
MKHNGIYLTLISCLAMAGVARADGGMQTMDEETQHGSIEEKMFKQIDSNGDSAISKSEFAAFNAKRYKRMDKNGDGKITRDEMEAGHKKQGGGNNATTHLDTRFNAADANNDKGLDREEAKAMPMLYMYFDEVDANKDG